MQSGKKLLEYLDDCFCRLVGIAVVFLPPVVFIASYFYDWPAWFLYLDSGKTAKLSGVLTCLIWIPLHASTVTANATPSSAPQPMYAREPVDLFVADCNGKPLSASWEEFSLYLDKLTLTSRTTRDDLLHILLRDPLAIPTVNNITLLTESRAQKLIELHQLCGTFSKPLMAWNVIRRTELPPYSAEASHDDSRSARGPAVTEGGQLTLDRYLREQYWLFSAPCTSGTGHAW